MALITCYECGASISDQAAACPKCGAPVKRTVRLDPPPPPPRAAAPPQVPTKNRNSIGCVGLLVILVLLGIVSQKCDDRRRENAEEAAADVREQVAKTTRAADSVRVDSLLARPTLTRAEYVYADSLIHAYNLTIAHDSIHRMTVQLRVDSAQGYLSGQYRQGKALGWSLASDQLDLAKAPFTETQTRRVADMRKRIATERQKLERQVAAELRRQFARQYESGLLDKGYDATVTTKGAEATTLRVKWILVSRVLAHQMSQEPELFDNLRKLGFKRLEISDGYDEEWYWNL